MNLKVFQNAASACLIHVLVNSYATMLEDNSPGMFKVAYSHVRSH